MGIRTKIFALTYDRQVARLDKAGLRTRRAAFFAGRECNRPTLDSIRAAGFEVVDAEHTTLAKVPAFVRPLVVGTARATPGERHHQPAPSTTQRAGTS
jgi:hypothetical protein